MPYELLAHPTSSQVPYELLALVFVPKRPQKEIEQSLFVGCFHLFSKIERIFPGFVGSIHLNYLLLLFVGKPVMQKKQKPV